MDELRFLTGNCMKGSRSRPILSFDEAFTSGPPQLRLLKCVFTDVFGTSPRGHPKSKPFVDRSMAFYYADQTKQIWVRNYQILAQQPKNTREAAHLRFCCRFTVVLLGNDRRIYSRCVHATMMTM